VRELGTRARLQKDDGGWRISAKAGGTGVDLNLTGTRKTGLDAGEELEVDGLDWLHGDLRKSSAHYGRQEWWRGAVTAMVRPQHRRRREWRRCAVGRGDKATGIVGVVRPIPAVRECRSGGAACARKECTVRKESA
jgi:hypothetical protein